ncbi:hypothetical protein HQO83_06805 [Rhodococcus fascians]|nr:hypothetical protein [Rhodococcus fascians]
MKKRISTVAVLVGLLFAPAVGATASAQPASGPAATPSVVADNIHLAADKIKWCVYSKNNYSSFHDYNWAVAAYCWATGGKIQDRRP